MLDLGKWQGQYIERTLGLQNPCAHFLGVCWSDLLCSLGPSRPLKLLTRWCKKKKTFQVLRYTVILTNTCELDITLYILWGERHPKKPWKCWDLLKFETDQTRCFILWGCCCRVPCCPNAHPLELNKPDSVLSHFILSYDYSYFY